MAGKQRDLMKRMSPVEIYHVARIARNRAERATDDPGYRRTIEIEQIQHYLDTFK